MAAKKLPGQSDLGKLEDHVLRMRHDLCPDLYKLSRNFLRFRWFTAFGMTNYRRKFFAVEEKC